ncbi:MAG: cytochrome c biogenesis protein CcdA [Candidatus Omnitrophota bacterium]|jgi:thiol:disulfide interchange protein DsbD
MTISGSPVDFLLVFAGGLLASFTPCIYPLIPITVGYIGIEAGGSKRNAFILSLLYVTGIAVIYSLLGLIASLTGTIFGEISSKPVTHIFLGIVIIIFGISLLGFLPFPFLRLGKLPKPQRNDKFGAFVLGLSSGLVASPCLTPVLGSILLYLVVKKSLIYGSLLLFVFAFGMGTSLIIASILSSLLLGIPKLGKWMRYITVFLSMVLIIVGVHFIINGIRRIF